MIHLYHGFGKGKTTAAIGLTIRQLGAGNTVTFAQFLKDGTSSEVVVLKQLDVLYMHTMMPKCFVKEMDELELDVLRQSCRQVLEEACRTQCDCLILDELLDVIQLHLLEEDTVRTMLSKHNDKEIVLTGRNPSEEMMQMSAYCSEFIAQKHPYKEGIKARKGVEY